MPPRTRRSRLSAAADAASLPPKEDTKPLPTSDVRSARICVLPRNLGPEARIYTLNSPASGSAARFIACPDAGFFELTRVSPDSKSRNSWLVTEPDRADGRDNHATTALIARDGHLIVATPFDPVYFLIPVLIPDSPSQKPTMFLDQDHYFDQLESGDIDGHSWAAILSQPPLRHRLLFRLEAVCDSVSAGDESMFRLSLPKLRKLLWAKATRIAAAGLPPSIEARFHEAALERPLMSVKRTAQSNPDEATESKEENMDEIIRLLRIQIALDLALVPIAHPIRDKIMADDPEPAFDFSPLDRHLEQLNRDREAARASRSVVDSISAGYKRSFDADEKADTQAEKRRKKEEEEKRKKSVGRGIKSLQKADVSGMQKMSAFFKKA